MVNFKKNKYQFWHSPFALIILLGVFFLFLFNIIDLVKKERDTANTKVLIENKKEDLLEKKASLEESIERLKTEEGEEEIIRDKYQVAKQGEKMVVIVDEEPILPEKEEVIREKGGLWEFFKNIFR